MDRIVVEIRMCEPQSFRELRAMSRRLYRAGRASEKTKVFARGRPNPRLSLPDIGTPKILPCEQQCHPGD